MGGPFHPLGEGPADCDKVSALSRVCLSADGEAGLLRPPWPADDALDYKVAEEDLFTPFAVIG